MKLLIKNLNLLTGSLEQPLRRDVHLGIEGERIAFILDEADAQTPQRLAEFAPDRTISGHGKVAMPGLINTHTHVGMSILRNYGSDLNLQDWLHQKIFPAEAQLTPDDIHWASQLEMAEMIRGGTTGFVDMYYFTHIGAANVLRTGMRAKLCRGLHDTFEEAPGYAVHGDAYADFVEEWDEREGRLRVMMLVHSTYLPPLGAMREMGELARERGYLVHIHLHETETEIADNIERYGQRPIAQAAELGLLSERTVVAHCVHLNEEDRRILSRCGAHVSHCPTSNLKLASGIADVKAMLEAGIKVSIGTDGASSNNNLNMMEELHLAALLQKGIHKDPLTMPAAQMLHMATRQGALAMHMDPDLGLLQEGAPADLILLDTSEPHWVPHTDPVAAVVYAAQAADVDTVIVAGQPLMEQRELKTIDLEQVAWQVERLTRRIIGG